MSDITNNQRKTQGDASAPTTVAVTFIESNGNAKNYATKLDPVTLAVPGTSTGSGDDIRVLDCNEDTKTIWKEDYKTNIGEAKLWTKNQLQINRPVMLIVLAGDSGYNEINDLPGGSTVQSDDTNDEVHKVEVTNISKDGVKSINGNFSINPLIYSTYTYYGGTYTKVTSTYYSSTNNFEGGIDNAAGRHIVIDDNGYWNLVFVRKNTSTGYNQVILKTSKDGGRTWTEEVVSSVSRDQYQAQIIVDKLGTRHICWVERRVEVCPPVVTEPDTNCYDIVYRNKNAAGTFSATVVVSRTDTIYTGYQFMPNMQVKPDGTTIGFLWAGHYQKAQYDCLYRERAVDGTFSSEEIVVAYSFGSYRVDIPTFDYDSSGNPHVCWLDQYGPIYYKAKSGATWGAATQIQSAGFIKKISNLVIDEAGNKHLLHAYVTDAGAKLHRIYYQEQIGSAAWTARTQILTSAYQNSQIQIDKDLNIYIYTTYWNGAYWEGALIKLKKDLTLLELISLQLTTDVVSVATPYSRLPKSDAMWTQMSRQWGCVAIARASSSAWTDGDLLFYAKDISVIGTVDVPNKHDTYTTRIRGVFARAKFQKDLFAPAVFG